MSEAFVATVLKPLLTTAALPAAAAGLGVVAARAAGGRLGPVRRGAGLGLAAGLVAAMVLIGGRPRLPPADVLHWIPLGVAAAWLLSLVDELRAWPAKGRLFFHGLLFTALVSALLQPFLERWEPPRTAFWLAALALPALAVWWLADRPARRRPAEFALLPLTVAAGCLAGVMVLSGSAKSSQLAGALASGLAALLLAVLLGKLDRADGAPLAVALAALAGIAAHAQLFTEVHPACTALVGLSAAACGLGRLPLVDLLGARKRFALGLLGALLPAAAALLFAWSRFEPNPYAY